ncbi:MAG: hypothetical protein WCA08_26055 [Desulfoferrobacter sp.]
MATTTLNKLEVLKEAYPDETELENVLDKLLDTALSSHRLRLERYKRDLLEFEERYGMDSSAFYQQFESGQLGDTLDFFEWAGVYELREDLLGKIRRMEEAL